jgi:LysR family transcriptional regulator (chromosome initiation inhibitor)
MDPEQLRTLAAIVDEGSFEGAAYELSITPSAVSQRIKALETTIGQVVVQRTAPCRPTTAGEVLLRLARQQEVLHQEAWGELGGGLGGRTPLTVAVNADSLATWFGEVVAAAAAWEDTTLRLRVDDQDHTAHLLRTGAVLGGITSHPTPVSGCRSTPLGLMRYLPVATRELRERHQAGRSVGWEAMPVVRFNAKDDLQSAFLRTRNARPGPLHEVPASEAYAAAVRAGLGWGMLPVQQLGDALVSGDLVRLSREHIDVPLHWHVWRMESERVGRLTDAVVGAARRALRHLASTSAE